MSLMGAPLHWRIVTLLSSLALLSSLGVLAIGSAAAQTGLTVSNLVITNASGQQQMNFGAGQKFYFHYTLTNSTSQTITVEFQYYAYWGTVDERPNEIIHHIYTGAPAKVSVPPGSHTEKPPGGYYTLPSNALPGFYSLQVTVDDQHNTSDASSEWQWFNVTSGFKPLNVPYYSQFQKGNPSESEDCGPTSVAMALSYYNMGPNGTVQQKIYAVRTVIADNTSPPDWTGPTTGPELVTALNYYSANDSLIYEDAAPQNTSVPAQLSEIAAAVKVGEPVIVFIDAQNLGNGRDYTGHFLVVVGFGYNIGSVQGVSVLVNDPDSQHLRGQAKPIPLGAFTNPANGTFGQALEDATSGAGGDPENIAAIAVTS